MSDALYGGRLFRTFNVVDDVTRNGLAIEVNPNLVAARVMRVLDRRVFWWGYPAKLRMDNGPELVSVAMVDGAEQRALKVAFIEPGKPTRNGYIERFNRTYRNEVLDLYVFSRLSQVRQLKQRWLNEYNEERPHDCLGHLTRAEYPALNTPETSRNGA